MPSLDEAYDQRWGRLRDPRRVIAGIVLVSVGVLALIASLLLVGLGSTSETAKLYAGTTAGAGIPLLLLGVVVVLPTSLRNRLGVIAGTTLAGLGVVMFWNVYPARWTRTADPLAFETLILYGIGCAIALWFVFIALATFRLRNNPQGTVRMEVIRQGSTRTVEVSRDRYTELVSDGGDAEQVIKEIEER